MLDKLVGASKSVGSSFPFQTTFGGEDIDVTASACSISVILHTRAHQETLMKTASLTDGRHGSLIPYSNSASNGYVMQWLYIYECNVLQSAGAESPA